MFRRSLRNELRHLQHGEAWVAVKVDLVMKINNNNNSDVNENRLCIFVGHIAHINSNLHVTQAVTFLLHS